MESKEDVLRKIVTKIVDEGQVIILLGTKESKALIAFLAESEKKKTCQK